MAFALLSIGQAQDTEYVQLDVKGLPGTPKADKEGFSVALTDSRSPILLVSGVATVRDTVGAIEAAELIVQDKAGNRLSRALLLPWRTDKLAVSSMEFNLRRDLLEKSFILIRTRKGDRVTTSKVMLGTFHVVPFKK